MVDQLYYRSSKLLPFFSSVILNELHSPWLVPFLLEDDIRNQILYTKMIITEENREFYSYGSSFLIEASSEIVQQVFPHVSLSRMEYVPTLEPIISKVKSVNMIQLAKYRIIKRRVGHRSKKILLERKMCVCYNEAANQGLN